MKPKEKTCGCGVISVLAMFAFGILHGEVVPVDVAAWAEIGTGTTNGWEVCGIDRYSKSEGGYTRFDTKDDFVLSPVFASCVTQVVIRVKSSSALTRRFLTLTPTSPGSEERKRTATPSTSLTNEVFVWAHTEGVEQFRLQNDSGTGNATWGIASLVVYTDRIEAPTELTEAPKWRNAFLAHWKPDPFAVLHEMEVCSVVWVPPQGERLHLWDFSTLTNATGNTKNFRDLTVPESLSDVRGENLCLQGGAGGHLQIGKSDVAGTMLLPTEEGGVNRTGLLRLFKNSADDGSEVSLAWRDAAGATNELATVSVTAEPQEFQLQLLDETTAILVFATSSRRVRVEEASVVSDYVPGFATTNLVAHRRTARCDKLMKDLAPGKWVWRVRSFDARQMDSPWSDFHEVTLDYDAAERPSPGFKLLLR